MLNRREALKLSTCGIGSIALAGLCQQDAVAAPSYVSPLSPKQPHHTPRAKRMIFLHMRGGPSHMETFEIKPELNKRNGEPGKNKSRKLVGNRWPFRQRGESGLWVSDLLKHQARHADDPVSYTH